MVYRLPVHASLADRYDERDLGQVYQFPAFYQFYRGLIELKNPTRCISVMADSESLLLETKLTLRNAFQASNPECN